MFCLHAWFSTGRGRRRRAEYRPRGLQICQPDNQETPSEMRSKLRKTRRSAKRSKTWAANYIPMVVCNPLICHREKGQRQQEGKEAGEAGLHFSGSHDHMWSRGSKKRLAPKYKLAFFLVGSNSWWRFFLTHAHTDQSQKTCDRLSLPAPRRNELVERLEILCSSRRFGCDACARRTS